MPTFSALTTINGQHTAKSLSAAMERLTPEPTAIGLRELKDGSDLWEVEAYFAESPDPTPLAVLAAAFAARRFTISTLPETDWVAQVRRALAPIRAGRFFLYGSHDADNVPKGVVALKIDAAMAFGTGHHGTTQGCLIALDRLAAAGFCGQNVADIGCGTAVLAMAAAKIWPEHTILASDIDQTAVETARANVRRNHLEARINCVVCAGFADPKLARKAPFDLIFANILKAPLLALAPDMAAAVAVGGYAILSGILNEQADAVLAAYTARGFVLANHDRLDEWSTVTLKKSAPP